MVRAVTLRQVIHGVRGMIWDALLCFNHALVLSASFESFDSEQQKTALEKLDTLSSRMKLWADNAPQNFAQPGCQCPPRARGLGQRARAGRGVGRGHGGAALAIRRHAPFGGTAAGSDE